MVTAMHSTRRYALRVLILLGICLLLLGSLLPGCLAQGPMRLPRPLPAFLSFDAKDIPLAQALRQLAEQSKFNFVMAEAPEPGDGTSVQFTNLAFSKGLEKLCEPFDYNHKKGAGNILLFECQYTNLLPMPPLTMGEVWAYLEDLEQLAKPYRTAKGDGISKLCRQLVRSLTPPQWQTLRNLAKEQKGLTYAELSPAQQRLLRDYVTSQEFDFFAVDTQTQPWFQMLQHEENVSVELYEPGSISKTHPNRKYVKYIFVAHYLQNGRLYDGLDGRPFERENHEDGSSYRKTHSRPIQVVLPQMIAHDPPLEAKRVHLYALNAPLTAIIALIEEQTGEKIAVDKAIGNVRLSLWLDDVSFVDAMRAIAALQDWYFSLRDDGTSLLLRHRNESPPSFSEVPERLLKALPVAVRRYMQLDVMPKDVTEEQLKKPGFLAGYNWKVKEAIKETRQRIAAWDFAPFRKSKQALAWKALKRWQQNDFLMLNLLDLLNYARPLHRGYPAYVAFPQACVLRMSDPKRASSISLEIYAHGPDGKYSALGAGGASDLEPEVLAALQKQGILPTHP
jgi:hypothetical protein